MTYNAVNDFIRKSNHVAIYFEDQKITYSELYDNVSRYSNKLLENFSQDDEIVIMLKDCPEYFYLFWGAIKAGIKPMLVNTMLTEKETKDIIDTYNPKYVFNDTNIAEFDSSATNITDNTVANTTKDDICFYMFSSGTTGFIKRIPHKHKDIVTTCINYAKKVLYMNAYDVCFSAAKLFFAYGFGNTMTFPLYVGASTVLMSENSTAKNTLDIIEKYKPTIFFGVPTLYSHQLNLLNNRERDLSSLRLCVSAGEPLPATIYKNWKDKTNTIILDGIGTTEALHIFISNRREDHEPNCSGKIVPGYMAKIVDVSNKEVEDGEVGYLKIKGDSISGDEEWLFTGDMFIKKGSKFYYQGRSNDMIKIGGIWVSPSEIESKILEHDSVLEVGVVQSVDSNSLVKIKAYVVLNKTYDDKDVIKIKNEIKKRCIEELPANHYPYWIEFVNQLPKTATGKIKRFQLRILEAFLLND